MLQWAKDWAEDKIAGYAKTGIQAGGTLAGNAVGGVGSLVESSGKAVGTGIAGAIGGVGNYVNGYGDWVKNSMAADGPVSGSSAEKKTAVKPTTAVKKAGPVTDARKGAQGAKALPAPTTRSSSTSNLPKTSMPSKPPPSTNRNLPAKKPASASTAPSTAKRPAISTSQSEKTADGKIKVSSASRPTPVKPNNSTTPSKPSTNGVTKPTTGSTGMTRPTPVRAPVSTRQSPTRADGKVKISAESRPRPVKAN